MRITRSFAPWLVASLTTACSLDQRELSLAGGGSRNGESGGASDLAGQPSGSSGTSGVPVNHLVDGCADLDTDGVGDCTTTLLDNPDFDEDVGAWQPLGDAELTWASRNALEDLPSGSARLESTSEKARAAQCVRVDGEKVIIAYASAFVESESALGQATLEVSMFDDETCRGEPLRTFETPPSGSVNDWTTIHGGAPSLPETRSVSIALVSRTPDRESPIRVYFDNVMLKAKAFM